jgi:hypothetical protein
MPEVESATACEYSHNAITIAVPAVFTLRSLLARSRPGNRIRARGLANGCRNRHLDHIHHDCYRRLAAGTETG